MPYTPLPIPVQRGKKWETLKKDVALSLTLLQVIFPSQLFPVFYAVVGVSSSQKGDNF